MDLVFPLLCIFVQILSIEMQKYPLERGTENCLLYLNAKRCDIYGMLIHS